MAETDFTLKRTPSEQLIELHVYIVPPASWREQLQSAFNTVIDDTVSAGFIRVHPEKRVLQLRDEIKSQLQDRNVPEEFFFLKSVGRCLTKVKPKQEHQLKAKHFLPPLAYFPEIFLLEATPEVRAGFNSNAASERSISRERYQDGRLSDDFNRYQVVPPIDSRDGTPRQNGDNYSPLSLSNNEAMRFRRVSQSGRVSLDSTNLSEEIPSYSGGSLTLNDSSAASMQRTPTPWPATSRSEEYQPPLSATPPHSPRNQVDQERERQLQLKAAEEEAKRKKEEEERWQKVEEERQRADKEEEKQRAKEEEKQRQAATAAATEEKRKKEDQERQRQEDEHWKKELEKARVREHEQEKQRLEEEERARQEEEQRWQLEEERRRQEDEEEEKWRRELEEARLEKEKEDKRKEEEEQKKKEAQKKQADEEDKIREAKFHKQLQEAREKAQAEHNEKMKAENGKWWQEEEDGAGRKPESTKKKKVPTATLR